MPDFLLEVGTEEVPASAVVPALEQLRTLIGQLLTRERVRYEQVRSCGTPRRLVAYAEGLEERQQDAVLQQRGPTRAVAFDAAGHPTRAAEGFARRHGVSPAELIVRQTDTGEYVFAEQRVEGRPTREVLAEALPGLLAALTFPKFMRWGDGTYRFSRPIRWITAALGAEVVPFTAGGVAAGMESVGHRFLDGPATPWERRIRLERAEEYFDRMREARVLVDPDERRRAIVEQGQALADAEGIRVVWDPGLLHEVTYVVEYPTVFLGEFSEEYLELPRPALVSAMRKHQRYFYLERPDGSLAPRFLAVRNGGDHGLGVVRAGNERVLAFRFNDARHHYEEDRKTTLEEKRARLKRVVFLEKLGTVWDKTERLAAVVSGLCEQLGREELREPARHAARLSKADLASSLVAELPELQGIIGGEYAREEGLDEQVVAAIREHYHPRTTGDPLPTTEIGRLLALADRLDLLAAAFSLGHIPTGSSDPFGLRRAAAGTVALLRELPASLTLEGLFDRSLAALANEQSYQEASPTPVGETAAELTQFFRARVEAVLQEQGIRLDLIEAVLGAGFGSIPLMLSRARFLQQQSSDPSWEGVVAVGTRIRNILKPDGPAADDEPAAGALEHATEKELAAELAARRGMLTTALDAGDWPAAWKEWEALQPLVDRFFVDVLVNVEDPALRAARRTLLRRLDAAFLRLADFGRIAGL